MLHAGEGHDLSATNHVSTNAQASGSNAPAKMPAGEGLRAVNTNSASAGNPLQLWLDLPTNADRSARADLTATNLCPQPDMDNFMGKSSPWITTATFAMGFFHTKGNDGPDTFAGCDRKKEDGTFQAVGIDLERAIDPGESGLSIGIGVSVGRTSLHVP